MSDNPPAPTLLDFLSKAYAAIDGRPEPATSSEVMMALVSVLSLYEAMRKMSEAMQQAGVIHKSTPEFQAMDNLLELTFRAGTQGLSDVLDRLAGEPRV